MPLVVLLLFPLSLLAERTAKWQSLTETIDKVLSSPHPIPIEEEAELGPSLALQALNELGRLIHNQELIEYVTLVGQVIATVSHRPQLPHYFAVCENPEPWTLATPGGYIFLTTGLLRLARNEDELAGILAHSIAHLNLIKASGFTRRPRSPDLFAELAPFSRSVDSLLDISRPQAMPPTINPTKDASNLPEARADAYALRILDRAGYRVQGISDFLAMFSQKYPSLYSCANCQQHQDPDQRIARLNSLIQESHYSNLPIHPRRTERFRLGVIEHLK